jgi:hypothetical protein
MPAHPCGGVIPAAVAAAQAHIVGMGHAKRGRKPGIRPEVRQACPAAHRPDHSSDRPVAGT